MLFLLARQSGKTGLPAGVVWGAISPIPLRRKRRSCHPRVTAWTDTIQTHVPHVSKPHATGLALGSLGMVLARAGALPAVRAFLAPWLGRKEHTVRQPLRAVCSEAAATRGPARWALHVEPCLVPLLAWVGSLGQGPPWALARDAPTLGTRLTVLGRSVA